MSEALKNLLNQLNRLNEIQEQITKIFKKAVTELIAKKYKDGEVTPQHRFFVWILPENIVETLRKSSAEELYEKFRSYNVLILDKDGNIYETIDDYKTDDNHYDMFGGLKCSNQINKKLSCETLVKILTNLEKEDVIMRDGDPCYLEVNEY